MGLGTLSTHSLGIMARALHTLKVDVSGIQSRWGTALGYPYVIQRLQDNLRLLSTLCSKIITVSEWYRKVLIRNGIQEQFVRFIPQAITLPSNAADAAKYPNNNRLKLVFVGRIAPQKGVLLLLKAVAGMDADRVELDLYGEATDPNYQATCREMSLNATNIHWKGRLDKEKVIDTLARYDILCLPSAVCEMSPLVIQEAFAAKVPVVASDNPGNAEQVEHGVKGWLFPSGNVQALTKQLNALADNAALVSEAKQRIGLITPFKDVVSAYLEEYRTMTGEITAVINS